MYSLKKHDFEPNCFIDLKNHLPKRKSINLILQKKHASSLALSLMYVNICNPNKLSICITNVNLQTLDFFDN